jgi:hypothetical protein
MSQPTASSERPITSISVRPLVIADHSVVSVPIGANRPGTSGAVGAERSPTSCYEESIALDCATAGRAAELTG